jgi:hypothetical protein
MIDRILYSPNGTRLSVEISVPRQSENPNLWGAIGTVSQGDDKEVISKEFFGVDAIQVIQLAIEGLGALVDEKFPGAAVEGGQPGEHWLGAPVPMHMGRPFYEQVFLEIQRRLNLEIEKIKSSRTHKE